MFYSNLLIEINSYSIANLASITKNNSNVIKVLRMKSKLKKIKAGLTIIISK